MARRQNLAEFLALADDAELTRALAADYLFTYAEAQRIRTVLSARTRTAPSRPTGRATVQAAHLVQPIAGIVPAQSPSRALEVIGS
jgi:hypothetical protein